MDVIVMVVLLAERVLLFEYGCLALVPHVGPSYCDMLWVGRGGRK